MDEIKTLISEIRAALRKKKFTVYRLAKNAGVTPSTVARILSGETKQPSYRVIASLATASRELEGVK